MHGFWGAVLVMTLARYPLVYLPVAAGAAPHRPGPRGGRPQPRARSRRGRSARVTLHQIRPALLGGCLLVALILLAEYGAFEILRFQTFTTQIFTEFQLGFNSPAACALSLVLVALGLLVLLGEAALRPARPHRASRAAGVAPAAPGRGSGGHGRPCSPAWSRWSRSALGLPLGALVYWLVHGTVVDAAADLDRCRRRVHTAVYAALRRRRSPPSLALPIALARRAPPQPARDASSSAAPTSCRRCPGS